MDGAYRRAIALLSSLRDAFTHTQRQTLYRPFFVPFYNTCAPHKKSQLSSTILLQIE